LNGSAEALLGDGNTTPKPNISFAACCTRRVNVAGSGSGNVGAVGTRTTPGETPGLGNVDGV
jgi:hypothetical protein